jgi:hypothetical protein
MCVLSRGIWFTVTNNQTNHHPRPTAKDPPTGNPTNVDNRAVDDPHNPSLKEIKPCDSGAYSRHHSPDNQLKAGLVDGYTRLITDRVSDGWSCHLVTILFSQLPDQRSAVIDRMKDEVERVYSTLVTRVHRKPRTASTDELPVLIGAIDLPVYKRVRSSSPLVICNGGLHFHALILVPPKSRLKVSLADHFQASRALYAGAGKSIQRIDVRPVVENHRRVVDYVLKTILTGRLSYDEAMLVLPRARGELELT